MTRAALFFDFYRGMILPCLEENLLQTPHYFLNVTAPYFVAFSAIDLLSSIRDAAVVGKKQNNNEKIKSFLEDPQIWKYGQNISLRKLYLDAERKERTESDPYKKAQWEKVKEQLDQEWGLEHHIEYGLVSLQPDCSYGHFLERVSALKIPIKNHENYKYSHLLYTLRCDLMHENRPTEQDAMFAPEERIPRYENIIDKYEQRNTVLSFPPRTLRDILSNAIDYLEQECERQNIDPDEVKAYKGLSPDERRKVALVL